MDSNDVMNEASGYVPPAPTQDSTDDSNRLPTPRPSAQMARGTASDPEGPSSNRSSIKKWFNIGFSSLGFTRKKDTLPVEEYNKMLYAAAMMPGCGDPTQDLVSKGAERLPTVTQQRAAESANDSEPSSPSAQTSWFTFPWYEKPVTAGTQSDSSH